MNQKICNCLILFVGTFTFAFAPVASAQQQQCTTDARQVIDGIYEQVLARSADAGSAAWTKRLETGTVTVRELVRDIAASPEYDRRFFSNRNNSPAAYERAVSDLYERLLGRQPSQFDRRGYVRMATDTSLGLVVNDIIASPEYQRVNGDWKVPGNTGINYCVPAPPAAAQATPPVSRAEAIRFRGMDRDNSGTITQREWRGSAQSFRVHDWNGDRVLSGDEIRAGGVQRDKTVEDGDFDRAESFRDLDADRDGWIEWREWHGTSTAFQSLDRNNDNVLSQAELRGTPEAVATTAKKVVVVSATERWVDTGINVRAGDTVSFDASGTIQLGQTARDTATPDGPPAGWIAPNAPVRNRPSGALVARVGNGAPFFVGARDSIQAATNGRLYLTNNDDYLGDNAGEFRVTIDVTSR